MAVREPVGRAALWVPGRPPTLLRKPRPDAAQSRPATPILPRPASAPRPPGPAALRPAVRPPDAPPSPAAAGADGHPASVRPPDAPPTLARPSGGGQCEGGAARAADHLGITGRQREILQGAALASVQSLLVSARTLLDKAVYPGGPHWASLLTTAGALYTYALEEYGKMLLLGRIPEKGGIVSVPYREIFRSHRKKFDAALGALPPDCALMTRGPFDPGPPCSRQYGARLDASFASRTHLLYLDITCDGHPALPDSPDPEQLARAVGGLERAATELAAKGWTAGPGRVAPGGEGG